MLRNVHTLPHPHIAASDDADPDERFARIVRAIAEIGRRNDEMRQRIASNLQLVDRLIAEGDRLDT